MSFQLRDYQAQDFEKICEAFRAFKSILYVLPTGGGKTRIFSYMAWRAHQRGNSSCIVVHRQELVIQTSISLAELGLEHRIIAPAAVIRAALAAHLELFGRSFIQMSAEVMVASVQTLVKRLDLLAFIKLLIIDEAHHTAAGQWLVCFQHAKQAKIIGVTATPKRLDGKGLGQHYEHMIIGLTMLELIARGFLCQPKVFAPKETVNLDGIRTKFGDYHQGEVADRMDTPPLVGNAVSHYAQLCPNVPAIAYCCSIEHAQHVAEQFRLAGFRATSIDGGTDGGERRKAIKDLGEGRLDVLTSCDIISEGTDIPLVGCGIMLRPTKSLTLWLQQAGRVLRTYPDKPVMQQPHMQRLIQNGQHVAFLLDHANNTAIHGMPQQTRQWALEYDKAKRGQVVDEVEAMKCPQCLSWQQPVMFCRECGYDFRIEKTLIKAELPVHVEGQLEEIEFKPEWAGGVDVKNEPLKKVIWRATSEQQFIEIARARGYKMGWVRKQVELAKQREQRAAPPGGGRWE